jgi:hypothetical protein
MPKGKINVTMDQDLIEYAKIYASEQRTTVSEVFSQFILNLKRVKDNDPTLIIIGDPDFMEGLLVTASKLRTGEVEWYGYEEVFK